MISTSFLSEDVAGLDISDGHIAAARFKLSRSGAIELTSAGWTKCDPGLSEKAVAAAVKSLWRRCDMPTSTVCSCLRSRSLAFHYFRYTNTPESDLEPALWLRGEEMLQLPRQEIVIDWRLNPQLGPPAGSSGDRPTEGALIAVPRKDVERHLRILEMAGLYPTILDVASMAIGNLYLALNEDAVLRGPICLVSLSSHSADLAILRAGEWIYPHSIAFSASAERSFDYLSNNVSDILKYFRYKLRHDPVVALAITGQIPAPEQLPGVLRQQTGLPVEIWDPLPQLAVKSSRLARKLSSEKNIGPALATGLGLALRRD